jgi:predicted component of type VI protein secretion system
MEAKLRVVGGAKPAVIRLKLPTVIGRSSDATLKIKSSRISRNHCEIDQFEGELTVRDLESSNGTYVNGHRIAEVTYLSPGDELRIGPLTLRAEYEVAKPPEFTESAQPEPMVATGSLPAGADHAHDVVDDDPAAEKSASGISSIVRYEEKPDGSFLGIEEIATPDNASDPPATATPPGNAELPDVGLEIGKPITAVDPGDSQLNKFLDGLS